MSYMSINPATGSILTEFSVWDPTSLESYLQKISIVTHEWNNIQIEQRVALIRNTAMVLRNRIDEFSQLMTLEMGKLISESRAEIEKCAWLCEYYADNGAGFLTDEVIKSDAEKSYVAYQPLGTILAVMPWNFPFWQVFRFAIPALLAGNTCVLKHASNVPQCAIAIEGIFADTGYPKHVFTNLMISSDQVHNIIHDHRIHAVSLTGSEEAGQKVAATAGANIKKCVLELGGSDPFIVLDDADMDLIVKNAVAARFLNAGQSCIAAKRMIVLEAIAEPFVDRLTTAIMALVPGDPLQDTTNLAPMARSDLRDKLHNQIKDSIAAGAVPLTGCAPVEGRGFFYQPSLLDRVQTGMRAYHEELFGPVAVIIRAKDEEEAIHIANDTRFGLGGSVWTRDIARGERIAKQLQSGMAFVNGMVKSDPRLPVGGIKASGFGRELSHHGIREFVNAKTVWIGGG